MLKIYVKNYDFFKLNGISKLNKIHLSLIYAFLILKYIEIC